MERLKSIKCQLISCVESQMGDLKSVDTKELGEVIDMIKDLAKAIYYCTVTEAMEKTHGSEGKYSDKYYPYDYYQDMDYSHSTGSTDDWAQTKISIPQKTELTSTIHSMMADIMNSLSSVSPSEKSMLQEKFNSLLDMVRNM